MEIPVLVEKLADGRYVARGCGLSAEGASDFAALANLQLEVDRVIRSGGRVLSVIVPDVPASRPLVPEADRLDLDDPMVKEWMGYVEEFRRERDRELEQP